MILKKLREIDNTGFTSNKNQANDRLVKKDGKSNVKISGTNTLAQTSLYHFMLNISNLNFFLMVIFFYTVINLIFAVLYISMGIEHLNGIISGSLLENFVEAYFFSSQTLTTVGYGRVSPVGLPANILASFEALIGILTLAIITGLLYGRFTKPKAYIKFSEHALITPFKNGLAFMFRLAPTKSNPISELSANVILSLLVNENGVEKYSYYNLNLQLDKILALTLNWTIVHPIDEGSPLFGLKMEEIIDRKMQCIVYIKGFDEGFSNTVISRTSYTWKDLVYNAKFKPMFKNHSEDNKTILELDKIDDYEVL